MSSPFGQGRPKKWEETDGMSALPKTWGAYRFKGHDGVDYLGITSNIYNRISQHRSVKTYFRSGEHYVEYQEARVGTTWDELCSWEKTKIQKHSPNLVTYIGGNGRRPAIQVNGKVIEIADNESIEDTLIKHGLFSRMSDFIKSLIR
ncbi:GIY-YIG nuclease family protein [Vibrio sp. B1Z05]|uniref:GIY-YIG nuclease family protein n=1 Tax=Vibrio sp. B1Z05 TaxID=2654980 RepID=UPI00128DA1C1|nr:GIY-YIG nuclease family protein [Vibrio sp. B1Z05]MPW36185.1 hypothetical protein [Vibrio sp. B1Z05]